MPKLKHFYTLLLYLNLNYNLFSIFNIRFFKRFKFNIDIIMDVLKFDKDIMMIEIEETYTVCP